MRLSPLPRVFGIAMLLVLPYVHADAADANFRIISRKEWGANEELLYRTTEDSSESSSTGTEEKVTEGARADECDEAQRDYPNEFKVSRTETTDKTGKRLRWPHQYSKQVRLLVVHHTAGAVGDEERSGMERVRAIYEYHAKSRGWGDVGYHYLIDEDGKIYEGRSGGKYVVGGHAYCNNIGSVGVALLGDFEIEKPTQTQMKSLQWLLDKLADDYGIDPDGTVTFHGKTMPTIVGHRDLLSTDCPGYYAYQTLSQVRRNVTNGDLTKSVTFPAAPKKSSSSKPRSAQTSSTGAREGLTALGETTLSGRPGSQLVFSMRYKNGAGVVRKGAPIASIVRDEPTIGLWQDKGGGTYERVRNALTLPQPLPPNGTVAIRLKVQFPQAEGTYQFSINGVRYTLEAKGRRTPMPRGETVPSTALPKPPRYQPLPLKSSSSARAISSRAAQRTKDTITLSRSTIRIRLSKIGETATLTMPVGSDLNGDDVSGNIFLFRDGSECVAAEGKQRIASGRLRLTPGGGISTIASIQEGPNRYRGVLECRIDGDEFVLINEIGLEDYMAGLAEEPDSEPWEKQRAFAIAARTYAAYYLGEKRKFPGRAYDGSDNPADFQAYGGVAFEEGNPRWMQSVRDTAREVLAIDGVIIRPPYFSVSDGRTLSPEEAGWDDFPFAEIFESKPDPWCEGMTRRGHGVGMSGCGAEGQADDGKTAEQILGYYYPTAEIAKVR